LFPQDSIAAGTLNQNAPDNTDAAGVFELNADSICARLSPPARALLHHVEVFRQVDSTNSRLLDAADGGAVSGTAYVAAEQTEGRGRQGRQWFSPPGGSVSVSLLWQLPDLRAATGMSLATGVAVLRALTDLGVADAGLKWPNDVMWRDRKLAGILVEARGGKDCAAVIGIGVNTAFPEKIIVDQPLVDLETILGQAPRLNDVAGAVLNELLLMLPIYQSDGRDDVLEKWKSLDVLRDRRVRVEQDGVLFRGIERGINEHGALLVETERGVRSFSTGELKVRADETAG
jgi:BirA family biotin operon repressor/biotin-[acetyl-CoA-carboxylase] ligase